MLKIKAETRWNLGFAFADATPDNTFGAQVKLFLGFQLLHWPAMEFKEEIEFWWMANFADSKNPETVTSHLVVK